MIRQFLEKEKVPPLLPSKKYIYIYMQVVIQFNFLDIQTVKMGMIIKTFFPNKVHLCDDYCGFI